MSDAAPVHLLFLASEPSDESRLQLGAESRRIEEQHQLSALRDRWLLRTSHGTRLKDLHRLLRETKPLIVHFSGHGAGTGGLLFEGDDGRSQPASTEALEDLFRLVKDDVACVVLSACYSEEQAQAIAAHVPYVVGVTGPIANMAAVAFAVGFYGAVFDGDPIARAFDFGKNAVLLDTPPGVRRDAPGRPVSTGGPPVPPQPEHLKLMLLGKGGPVLRLPTLARGGRRTAARVGGGLLAAGCLAAVLGHQWPDQTTGTGTTSPPVAKKNLEPVIRGRGWAGAFSAQISNDVLSSHRRQLEGSGLPKEGTIEVHVWLRKPDGTTDEVWQAEPQLDRAEDGGWKYKWVTLEGDGEYLIEVNLHAGVEDGELPQLIYTEKSGTVIKGDVIGDFIAPGSRYPRPKLDGLIKRVRLNVPLIQCRWNARSSVVAMMAVARYFDVDPTTYAEWDKKLIGRRGDPVDGSERELATLAQQIGLNVTHTTGAMSADKLRAVLSAGKLVLCCFELQGEVYFALITGYEEATEGLRFILQDLLGRNYFTHSGLLHLKIGEQVPQWTSSIVFDRSK